jgi:DNA-directed RNA polymerase beta subunit
MLDNRVEVSLLFIKKSERLKRERKLKRRKRWKKLAAVAAMGILATLSYNVSYAQIDIGGKINEWYSIQESRIFSDLDKDIAKEMALQKELLHSEFKLGILNMEQNVEEYTEDVLIPQYLQNLENYYQELIAKIKISNEEEKEAFRLELEASLNKARGEAAISSEVETVPILVPEVEIDSEISNEEPSEIPIPE